ncbi:MAG: hypothetical protein PHG63_01070 [Candidatus Dojkabacteria bacterium]|nr:hypothetical protein [Candidatus Dojkabacteria bacterium]
MERCYGLLLAGRDERYQDDRGGDDQRNFIEDAQDELAVRHPDLVY